MHFSADQISRSMTYKLLTSTIIPRPIAFVTTRSEAGVLNAAPFSYFNAMGSAPPIVSLGFEPQADGSVKDTATNIRATGEFVVNIVDEPLAAQMNAAAATLPPEADELALAGIETVASIAVSPPLIKAAPVNMECRLYKDIELAGGGCIILGEVLEFHVRDGLVVQSDPLRLDLDQLSPIGRLSGPHYARLSDRFEIERPG